MGSRAVADSSGADTTCGRVAGSSSAGRNHTNPTTTTFDAGGANSATKTITDIVLFLELNFTLDDNTKYPVYAEYSQLGGHHRLDLPDLITGATNFAAYMAIIQQMLDLIFDVAVVG